MHAEFTLNSSGVLGSEPSTSRSDGGRGSDKEADPYPSHPFKNDASKNVSFIFRNCHFDHGIPYSETSMICPVSLGRSLYQRVIYLYRFWAHLSMLLFVLLNCISSLTWDKFLNASRTTGLVGRKKKSFICQICWSVFLVSLAFSFTEACPGGW